MSTKLTKTLSKVQKNVLKELEETKEIYIVLDNNRVTEERLEFWRKTNFLFNEEYLKALGLTKLQERFLYVYPRKLFNVAATCRAVGIGRTTFYNWMNKVNTFRHFAHDKKEGLLDDIETLMFKKALEGDTRMLIHVSKSKMRDRGYGNTVQLIKYINPYISPYEEKLKSMTDEELLQEIAEMEQRQEEWNEKKKLES